MQALSQMTPTARFGAECVVTGSPRNQCGESPFWHAAQSALYWVDVPAGQIHRHRPASAVFEHWQLPEKVGCIAATPAASVIAACESGIFEVHLEEHGKTSLHQLASIVHPQPNMRFNDGRCDRQGRLWVGSMMMDNPAGMPAGRMYRYTRQEGLVASSIDQLITPNGLAFSPDGKRMYLSDSHTTRRLIWVFDYDTDSGTPHNRRLFADLNVHAGRPDGAAIDCEGGYWICAIDAACLLRFTPDGELDQRIDLPMQKPTMPAFGGAALDQLYVCSLQRGKTDLASDPYGGCLASIPAPFAGLSETFFDA